MKNLISLSIGFVLGFIASSWFAIDIIEANKKDEEDYIEPVSFGGVTDENHFVRTSNINNVTDYDYDYH